MISPNTGLISLSINYSSSQNGWKFDRRLMTPLEGRGLELEGTLNTAPASSKATARRPNPLENMSEKRFRGDAEPNTGHHSTERTICDLCKEDFNLKGYGTHRKMCEARYEELKAEEAYLELLRKQGTFIQSARDM